MELTPQEARIDYVPMPGGTLRRCAALRHVKWVHAVISWLSWRVHGHAPHIVESSVERKPCAHPQVHIRSKVVARRPEVVLVIAWSNYIYYYYAVTNKNMMNLNLSEMN